MKSVGFNLFQNWNYPKKFSMQPRFELPASNFNFFKYEKRGVVPSFSRWRTTFFCVRVRQRTAVFLNVTADRFLCCVAVSLSTVAAGKIKGEEVEQKNKKIKITAEIKWKVDARLISMFEQIQI